MGATPTLGPVIFDSFEVPESITVSGRQKLVVHSLPGGGRVVDAMGRDDGPIRWSGVFSGQRAAERVRTLDRLCRSATILPLSWDAWRFLVLIERFEAEVTSPSWIPYRIELCSLPQGADPLDWLLTAALPSFALYAGDLTAEVAASTATLGGGDLRTLIQASGTLAQVVTQQAYAGIAQ